MRARPDSPFYVNWKLEGLVCCLLNCGISLQFHHIICQSNASKDIILSMTADAVFARLKRRPFVPFRLILTSGTTYDIMHPEMLFVSKSLLTVALYGREQRPEAEEIPMRQ